MNVVARHWQHVGIDFMVTIDKHLSNKLPGGFLRRFSVSLQRKCHIPWRTWSKRIGFIHRIRSLRCVDWSIKCVLHTNIVSRVSCLVPFQHKHMPADIDTATNNLNSVQCSWIMCQFYQTISNIFKESTNSLIELCNRIRYRTRSPPDVSIDTNNTWETIRTLSSIRPFVYSRQMGQIFVWRCSGFSLIISSSFLLAKFIFCILTGICEMLLRSTHTHTWNTFNA